MILNSNFSFIRLFIVFITFLIFSNFILYQTYILNIAPFILWGLILSIIITYKFLSNKEIKFIFSGLLVWSIYYFILTTSSFILSIPDDSTFNIYKKIIVSLFALSTTYIIFNYDNYKLETARQTIFYTMIFSVFLLIFDFISPGYFIDENNDRYIAGRAAAMFINPNIAGTALIISLILSIDVIEKKWQFLVISFVFIGVIVTFSRASIIVYIIVVLILLIQKKIEFKKILFLIFTLLFSFSFLLTYGVNNLEKKGIKTDNVLGRISFLETAGNDVQDNSYYERKMILEKALDLFADNPIFGAGFGATRTWNIRVSAHNMYAVHWAEYGVFGMMILPLLLFLLYWKAQGEVKQTIFLFILFILFRSIFTHNILDSYFILASFSIIMLLNLNSRKIDDKKQRRL